MFINKSKIQFEIYSQLGLRVKEVPQKCLSINQRYNLKSIHNKAIKRNEGTESVYQ